ncbi:unnamed protein product [Vitrella brassicaformis CCMP3155]|uniref:Uncharacterized protein n=1 Tax=Vitrella brassicaformis (strain CCMP3155) TaxID=1169540 RepID=A0A0G4FCJ7_VITBC|nr:unnamed protein product [Vitrella brassicaformis CCMP3155]|eukprot:CEM10953.1 unnamed protein product [Vitrella brassicaformis CCMP3155]
MQGGLTRMGSLLSICLGYTSRTVCASAHGGELVDTVHDLGTSHGSIRLADGIICRTFSEEQQVRDLIERHGADPNHAPGLRAPGSSGRGVQCPLLALAIDTSDTTAVTIHMADGRHGHRRPLALPRWSSPELQAAIINALIDGGANMQGLIRMAVWCGNESAVRVFLARSAAVRPPHGPVLVMELPWSISDRVGRQVSLAYEQRLLSIYRRLIQHDATLATEQEFNGNLIYNAAHSERGYYSQAFIDSYLDLLVDNGASLTAVDGSEYEATPLHVAALKGSRYVTDYLCRHVAAADIDRETTGRWYPSETPLYWAARKLNEVTEVSQGDIIPQSTRDRATRAIPRHEATIRSLLRSGADIGRIPTDEKGRECRQLVLPQCTTVLNDDVHTGAMAAVNAALAPQRSLAALLMKSLPALLPHLLKHPGTPAGNRPPAPPGYGPHEAEAIGWRIAAMCFDQDAANEAITANIGIRHSDMARRVQAAVKHVVKSAVFAASSNREVVGGMADVGGVTVRVPLQCFAIAPGADTRSQEVVHTRDRLGLREVVHRARLDEAARYGLEESIVKGFNQHLGNDDCQFAGWQQLGRVDKGGRWVTLGIQ